MREEPDGFGIEHGEGVLPAQTSKEIIENRHMRRISSTKRIAISAVLVAVTVVLSHFLHFPIGPTKCQPAQHMINAISGIILGPWYAALIALMVGIIRNAFASGTIYAFPGGIPGALMVGLIHRYLKRTDYAAFMEPLGTVVIGATLSALLVAPWQGSSYTLSFFWIAFAASSVPGSALGFIILKALRRAGFVDYFTR